MPQDIQRSIVPMAPSIERSPDSPKMRPFSVPFEIKGARTIFAEDLEGAVRLAEHSNKYEYAFYGELRTYDPEPVMRIDLTSPEGNTLSALGIATRMLKAVNAPKEEIDALRKDVFNAKSAAEARTAITLATNGAIEFYDPREEHE